MINKNILIVEDEEYLGATLTEYLTSKDYKCSHAKTAKEALSLFKSNLFTIVLMDINLPDGNGIELAKNMRKNRQNFVLIYLSAQNDPETKYHGLEMGAEDFITKPFDLRELTLRLDKALLTHEHLQGINHAIKVGQLEINFKEYYLIDAQGSKLPLGQKECAILELLYSRENIVISRDEIIDDIWGEKSFPTNRTVDNYIVKLRKWLETDPSKPVDIQSIRGVGYKLVINEKRGKNE